MAGSKRKRADDCPDCPSAKKSRSSASSPIPALTRRALRELDRRNALQPRAAHRCRPEAQFQPLNLDRLARHGGPDLCSLRGVCLPTGFLQCSLMLATVPSTAAAARHGFVEHRKPVQALFKINQVVSHRRHKAEPISRQRAHPRAAPDRLQHLSRWASLLLQPPCQRAWEPRRDLPEASCTKRVPLSDPV